MYPLLFVLVVLGCSESTPPESAPQEPVENEAEQPASVLFKIGGVAEIETQKNETALVAAKVEGIEGEIHVRNANTWVGLQGAVRIPIAAFESGLELRDTRIKETFFNSEQWPYGVLEFTLLEGLGGELGPGESRSVTIPGELTIGGGKGEVELKVKVSRSGERRFSVVTEEPLVLSMEKLGLSEPLARLVKLCAHESVRDEVKVSFQASITD